MVRKMRVRSLKLFVVSTKPYKRLLFFNLFLIRNNSKLLSKSLVLFKVLIFSNFGSFSFFFFVKDILKVSSTAKIQNLFSLGFVMQEFFFKQFAKIMIQHLFGIQFAWIILFSLEGYHFRAEYYFVKSIRRFGILFKLGFFYNLLIIFPKTFTLFSKKRQFKLRSCNLHDLCHISFYIRMLRNLFPYKVKGIIYDNLGVGRPDYEKELYVFKQGKKAKLR